MSIKVKAHTRGPDDPLKPIMDANLHRFESKWGVKVVSANDSRLAAPIPDPVPGPAPMPIEENKSLLRTLAAVLGVK